MAKISVDQEKCIGCGTCVSICDNFELIDGKSHPKKEDVEKITCEKQAEESCPVGAIKISE